MRSEAQALYDARGFLCSCHRNDRCDFCSTLTAEERELFHSGSTRKLIFFWEDRRDQGDREDPGGTPQIKSSGNTPTTTVTAPVTTAQATPAPDLDDLCSLISDGIYGDDRMSSKQVEAALGALSALRVRCEVAEAALSAVMRAPSVSMPTTPDGDNE